MSAPHPLEILGLTPRTKWRVENSTYDYAGDEESRFVKTHDDPRPWATFGPGFAVGPSFATHAEAIEYVNQKAAE